MKFKNIINLGLVVTAFAVAITGCKKQDFSNTDPDLNTTETVDFRTVMPASMTATATAIEGGNWKFLQNWMGYWARSGSYQDVTDEESYSFTNDFGVGVWNSLYTNATNYEFVIQKAKLAGAGTYEAIARIMKSLDFQMLVDVYGNVPYSKAFQGALNRTPAYDKGIDVYDSLFVDLDRAIALLKDPIATDPDKNKGLGGANPNDLIYKGDTQKWIKFANTLKLRMLVHAFQVPGFDVAGKAAIIEAEGSGYIGVGSSAELNPGYSSTKPNPFYRAYLFTETGVAAGNKELERANAYSVGPNAPAGVGYYQGDGDPRLDRFYVPSATGHKGIKYGQIAGTVANYTGEKLSSVGGPGYIPDAANSRAWIFTDFESLYLQAEAKERNITTVGNAQQLLLDGMTANFDWLGLTTDLTPPTPPALGSDLYEYLLFNAGYPDVDYTAGPIGAGLPGGGLFTILSQKWFSLNGINTLEVWTDWRRTDVVYGEGAGYLPGPPISINPARASTAGIPIRLFYPQNEYNYNADNVLNQGTIDVTNAATPATGRIFWDIN